MSIFQRRGRRGMSLLDVALATVIATITTIVAAQFFRNIYEQLSPRSATAGLRKYILSEEMLRAQAEGLRTLRDIPLTDAQCKLLTEPPKMGYNLTIARSRGPSHPSQELYYYDLVMTHQGQKIQELSMSTLRAIGTKEGQDEKIGL
jgi:hypothetical protein